MSTYSVVVNSVTYTFDFDNSVTPKNYLTYDEFIDERPTMGVFTEDQIQEAINISYSLLDAKTNFLISEVLNYNYTLTYSVTNTTTTGTTASDSSITYPVQSSSNDDNVYTFNVRVEDSTSDDTVSYTDYTYTLTVGTDGTQTGASTSKLYRTSDELSCILQALILQTQYTVNLSNDYTQGGGSLSTGGLSISYQRPTGFDRLAEGVLEGLQRARVYALNNALLSDFKTSSNPVGIKTPGYTKEEVNSNFVKQYQKNAAVGSVAVINESNIINFQDPSTLTGNQYNADKILDSDGSYKEIHDINNLAFYGNNGSDAVTRNEVRQTAKAYQYWDSTWTYSAGDLVDYIEEGTDVVYTYRSNQDNNLNYNPLTNNKDNYGGTTIYDDQDYGALLDEINSAKDTVTSLSDEVTTQATNIQNLLDEVNSMNLSNYVDLSTDQNINGVKTFKSAIYVKNPTGDYNPVTLTYAKSNFVDLSSSQTITGAKNFDGTITVHSPTSEYEVVNLRYLNANYTSTANLPDMTKYVDLSSDQNIAGVKTFTDEICVNTPTHDYNASTKLYVDNQISTIDTSTYITNTSLNNALSSYLTTASAASTYLTQTDASSTYATQTALNTTNSNVSTNTTNISTNTSNIKKIIHTSIVGTISDMGKFTNSTTAATYIYVYFDSSGDYNLDDTYILGVQFGSRSTSGSITTYTFDDEIYVPVWYRTSNLFFAFLESSVAVGSYIKITYIPYNSFSVTNDSMGGGQ